MSDIQTDSTDQQQRTTSLQARATSLSAFCTPKPVARSLVCPFVSLPASMPPRKRIAAHHEHRSTQSPKRLKAIAARATCSSSSSSGDDDDDDGSEIIAVNSSRIRHQDGSFHVSQLPPAAVSRILAFAVQGYVPVANCVPKCPHLPIRKLAHVASISTEWRNAVRSVVREFRRTSFEWTLVGVPSSNEELQHLQSEVERRGDELLDLRISIDAKLKPTDLESVQWDQVFAVCPKLQRLDVQNVPLESSALGRILDSVSSSCHEVEALVFSKRCASAKAAKKGIVANYDKLYEALEKWSRGSEGRPPALKQLTVPSRWEDETLAPSAKFVAMVAALCPSLEYLDGWKKAYRVDDFVECDEKWYIPTEIWKQFCGSTGTSLREFNWAVAPFHDEYFRIFAESPKVNLQRLCLTVSESWTWDDFKVPDEHSVETLIAPPTSKTLSLLARAVPQLEELHVIFHSSVEDPASVDTEAFGDVFLRSVADSCLSLREIKIVEIEAEQELLPISSITDEGLIALAKMEDLANVVISGVEGTSAGVFAFMEHWRTGSRQRTVDLGIDQGESGRDFYDAALGVLTSIQEEWSEGEDATTKVVVKLRNLSLAPDFKNTHLRKFCRKGNKLIQQLQTTHPWLRIAVESDGVEQEGEISAFSTVGKIVVSSKGANLALLNELGILAPASDVLNEDDKTSTRKNRADSSDSSDGSGYGSVLEDTASEDDDGDSYSEDAENSAPTNKSDSDEFSGEEDDSDVSAADSEDSDPESNTSLFDEDGFLHTGDYGYIDDDGFVFIVDRIKEFIKYEGHQVAPAELEEILEKHPSVADSCCVRGLDFESGEEIPRAYVVLKADVEEPVSAETLMAFVNAQVAPYKQIREVEFTDRIP